MRGEVRAFKLTPELASMLNAWQTWQFYSGSGSANHGSGEAAWITPGSLHSSKTFVGPGGTPLWQQGFAGAEVLQGTDTYEYHQEQVTFSRNPRTGQFSRRATARNFQARQGTIWFPKQG